MTSPLAAAVTVRRDWDSFVTFYDFPAEHWIHLRTSNPIESLFAGVCPPDRRRQAHAAS